MPRKFLSLVLSLVMWAPAVRAGDPMVDAVAQIPADAMAVLCIPSLKQLDADYKQAIVDLGLQDMVQPPANSLLSLVKGSLPIFAQMDETRPFTVVVMPASNMMEFNQKIAMIVPVGDPKSVVEGMGATAGEGGIYAGSMMGQPAYFGLGEKRMIVAQSDAVAKAIVANPAGLDKIMKADELKSFENLDILLWVNADQTMKTLKPMIEGFMPMLLMSMQSTPSGAKQAEMTKKQIDMLVDGMASMTIGIALDKAGLGLRGGMTSKPGSELAAQSKMKPTTDSLLKGLPGDKYLAAFGQTVDPEQTRAAMKQIDPYLNMLDDVAALDKDKVGQLKGIIKEVFPMMAGARGVVQMMPGGSAGLIGFSMLIDTPDSAQLIALKVKAFETAKELASTANDPSIDDEAKKMIGALNYKADAEEIGGLKIGHLSFDLSQVPDMDEEQRDQLEKVIGKDGLLFRSAAVNDKVVAMTFGGGADYMGKIIETAKKDTAPLDANAGIVKVNAQLPKARASVAYISIDQILAAVNRIAKELEEEEIPVTMPALQSPIALASTGGNEWSRFDIVFPTEVLKAGKDAVMGMMAGPGEDEGGTPDGHEGHDHEGHDHGDHKHGDE